MEQDEPKGEPIVCSKCSDTLYFSNNGKPKKPPICKTCRDATKKSCVQCGFCFIPDWSPSDTLCKKCAAIEERKRNCDECNVRYLPGRSSTMTFCETCHLNKNGKSCELCEELFFPSWKREYSDVESEWKVRCSSCIGMSKLSCDICKNQFIGKREWRESMKCKECIKVTNCLILNERWCRTDEIEDRIDPKFLIKVTYEINQETHSGYCSDPGEIQEEEFRKTYVFPLLTDFENRHLDRDGEVINLTSGPILYYRRMKDGCGGGSGYCGCDTTYKIVKAVVIKDERKIDLGK